VQVHEHLRFMGSHAMSWFFFGIGVNTAAVWAILGKDVRLKTNIIPLIFVGANSAAAIGCFTLPYWYDISVQTLNQLAAAFIEIANSKQLALLPKNPAFQVPLWNMVACLLGGLFLCIAIAWYYGMVNG